MSSQRSRSTRNIGNRISNLESKQDAASRQTSDIKVTQGMLEDNAVGPAALEPNAVGPDALARGAVGTENLGIVNEIISDSNLLLQVPQYIRLDGPEYVLAPGAVVTSLNINQAGQIILGVPGGPSDPSETPAMPDAVSVSSEGDWDILGNPYSKITIGWVAVTQNTGGSSITIDRYEVWSRLETQSVDESKLVASIAAMDFPSAVIYPLQPNTAFELKVRAISTGGVASEFTAENQIVTVLPPNSISAPSTPTLGSLDTTLSISWDGFLGSGAPPVFFAYTFAEISDAVAGPFTPVGGQLSQAGSFSVSNLNIGDTRYVRLRSVDKAGRWSTPSTIANIVIGGPSLVPAAPTGVTLTSTGYWDGTGKPSSSLKVTWAAVTKNVNGQNLAVDSYEVWTRPTTDVNVPYQLTTTVMTGSALSATIQPYDANVRVFVQVLARSYAGAASAFSTATSVLMINPSGKLPAPTTPTLTQKAGVLAVTWDGLLTSGTPPAQFDHLRAEGGTGPTGPWSPVGTQLITKGDVTLGVIPKNSSYWVRFIAVDRLNIDSDPSSTISATVLGVATGDLDASVTDSITSVEEAAAQAQTTADSAISDAATAQTAADAAQSAADAAQARADQAAFGTFARQPDSTRSGQWMRAIYTGHQQAANTYIPSYADMLGLQPSSVDYLTDAQLSSTTQWQLAEYYFGLVRGIVSVTANTNLSFTYSADDSSRVYVDGVSVNTHAGTGAQGTVTVTLVPGSHVIDLLLYEHTGSDYINTVTPAIGGQVSSLYPPVALVLTDAASQQAIADAKNAQTTANAAQTAAATAQAKADAAFANAATAQTTADGKNTVYYATSAPTGGTYKNNDIWFDTDDGYHMYQRSGTSWVSAQLGANALANLAVTSAKIANNAITVTQIADGAIATAKLAANAVDSTKLATAVNTSISNAAAAAATADSKAVTAQTTADGKNTVYYATSAPTGGTYKDNDIWFDTDDGNKIYHRSGASWVASQLGSNALLDQAITAAKIASNTITVTQIADGAIATAKLAANAVDSTKLAAEVNTALANAQADADTAAAIANTKGRVIYSDTQPTVKDQSTQNLWIDTLDGANTPNRWLGDGTPDDTTSSLVDSSGTAHTNLTINSSFESVTAGTAVMRNNLASDPAATADQSQVGKFTFNTRWFGSGSSGTEIPVVGASDGPVPGLDSYLRKLWATDSPGQDISFTLAKAGNQGYPVLPGQTYTISMYWRSSEYFGVGGNLNNSLTLRWFDSSGNTIGNSLIAPTTASPAAGQWQRLSLTSTAPAGAAYLGDVFHLLYASAVDTIKTGDTLDVTGLMVELSDTLGDYFDGSTPDGLGWDYAWAGTANASTSVAKAASNTIRTNLVTNPRGIGISGSAITGTTGWRTQWWGSTDSNGTFSNSNGVVAKTWSAAATANWDVWFGPLVSVTPGTIYSFQITCEVTTAPAGTSATGGIVGRVTFQDASGVTVGTSILGTIVPWSSVALGVPFDLQVLNVTIPAGAVYAYVTGYMSGSQPPLPAAGTVLKVSKPISEALPIVGDYFDGSSSGTGDFSYAWTGAVDASTSYQRGVEPSDFMVAGPAQSVQSSEWVNSRSKSMRIIPTTSNFVTYVNNDFSVTPGVTYTVLATSRLAAAQTGGLEGRARRMMARSSGMLDAFSTQPPNAPGVYTHRLTFTPTASTAQIYLWNGASAGGGDVWWDDLAVIEGDYDGSYFDGTTPGGWWGNGSWIAATDKAAIDAQATADSKNTVWRQTTQPPATGNKVNDIWYDTDDGNRIYLWSGTAWTAAQFGTNAIANLAITNALIADATIQNAKIATLDAAKITTGYLSAARIQAGSLNASVLTADTVTAAQIASNTITANELAANSVTATQLAANSVVAGDISANAVTSGTIAAGAVIAGKIAANSVTSTEMLAGTITAASGIIADAAITNAKIADATIQSAKIANLDAGKITTGTLDANRIGANTITAGKLIISDTEEWIPNPWFHPNGEPVTTGTILLGTDPEVPTGSPSAYVLKIQSRDNHPFGNLPNFPVTPGEKIMVGAWVAASTTTTRNFNHYMFRSPLPVGGLSAVASSGIGPTTTWTYVSWIYTVPDDGFKYLRPVLQVNTVTGDTSDKWIWYVTGWSAKRMTSGELIVDGAITASKIGAGEVVAGKLAANSVVAGNVAAGAVTAGTIAANAVTAGTIAANAVTATQIAAGSITAASGILADASVVNAKIADATIQSAKIANLDAGKITTGTLDANRIGANTISTQKLLVGNFYNLLEDPSFEKTDTTAWTHATSNVTSSTSTPRTGTRVLRIKATTAAYEASAHQAAIPVQEGEEYVFGAWVRAEGSGTTVDGGIELSIKSGSDPVNTNTTLAITDNPVVTTTYTYMFGVYTVPTGVSYIRPRFVVRNDTSNTNVYLIDDATLYKRVPGDLIVDGSVTARKIGAGEITSDLIKAGAISADALQANSVTAGAVAAGAITTEKLDVGAVTADKIASGTIQTNNLAPEVGSQLNIAGNVSITAVSSQIGDVSGSLQNTVSDLEDMKTVYAFDATGATISSPDSIFQVKLTNTEIQMLQNGNKVSYWNSGVLYVDSLVGTQVTLGHHKLEADTDNTGTVVRAL